MGSDVKRWDYVSGARRKTAVFEQCGDGRWVRYEDYRALEAERDRLREALQHVYDYTEKGHDIRIIRLHEVARRALTNGGGDSCDHACGPSDYHEGGKCDKNGCYTKGGGDE